LTSTTARCPSGKWANSYCGDRTFSSGTGAFPRPLEDGAAASEKELIAFTRERLAHFKCPTRVEFVAELPRNATGKILKTTLRTLFGGQESAVLR
jgi:acyl-CoA synthetase (AMP-forming)/AMP-acid ligase II